MNMCTTSVMKKKKKLTKPNQFDDIDWWSKSQRVCVCVCVCVLKLWQAKKAANGKSHEQKGSSGRRKKRHEERMKKEKERE